MTEACAADAIAAERRRLWPDNTVTVMNPSTSGLVLEVRKLEEGSLTRQVGEWRLRPGESLELALTLRQAVLSRLVRP
jgi:hypothetical protein